MGPIIDVHVWSDIACPWCFIGKRRFERAAETFGRPVAVEYHSFELAPDTPVDFEGSELEFLSRHKRIEAAQAAQMLEDVAAVAASEGLRYDFDALRHTKTLLAHQALHHAKTQGKQEALVERLFRAYFEEGRHVGRADELAKLAAEIGLDRDETLRTLDEGTYGQAVQQDIDAAQRLGIRGVPFYVLGGRYAVSGAQPPEVFLSALERVAGEAAA